MRASLFVFVLSLLLLVQQGTITGIDGESSYRVTRSLVEDADITLSASAPHTAEGRDGNPYSKFGIGLPLLSAIPYVLAKPFEQAAGDQILRSAVATLMPVITAILCLVLYEIGRALVGRPRDAVVIALVAVFGTYLLVYSKDFFSEPLLALAIALAFWRTIADHPTQAAACLAFGMLTRPQAALVAPLFWLYWLVRCGPRRSLLPGLVLAAGAGSLLLYNWLRFEDVTESGYPADQGFRAAFWEGAWGLLTEPHKSILLFAPLVGALPFGIRLLWKRGQKAPASLAACLLLVGLLTAAGWSVWWGGWTWGPRLALPALIPLLPVLAPWIGRNARNRRVVVVLGAVGALVNLPAVIVPTLAQYAERSERDGPAVARQYELIHPTLRNTVRNRQTDDSRLRLPDPGVGEAFARSRQAYLWQIEARRELGRGGWLVIAAISLLLVGAAVASGISLRRALRTAEA